MLMYLRCTIGPLAVHNKKQNKSMNHTSKHMKVIDGITVNASTDAYLDETSRFNRMRNIATFLDRNWEGLSAQGGCISFSRLRDLFIAVAGDVVKSSAGELLSALPGLNDDVNREKRLGDMRAHGDALGGHGFEFEIERHWKDGSMVKCVRFNDANRKKVDAFLKSLPATAIL